MLSINGFRLGLNNPYPDPLNSVTLRYGDLKQLSPEKLKKFHQIELVYLHYENQAELEEEVELLRHFTSLKYLVFSGLEKNTGDAQATMTIPNSLAQYKQVEAINFRKNGNLNYQHGLMLIRRMPNLKYLLFDDLVSPLPDVLRGFEQLKGISIESYKDVQFPEWITTLPNLESVSLSMRKGGFRTDEKFDHFYALTELQKLPLLKAIYLKKETSQQGDLSKLKFRQLSKVEMENVGFKPESNLMTFLSNHSKLRSISITNVFSSGSIPWIINDDFLKLKQLRNLTIAGGRDSLIVNTNLKGLHHLKSLEVRGVNLRWNQSEFPLGLRRLYITNVRLKELPPATFNLRKLESLTVIDSLRSLPAGIANLKRLVQLDLSENLLRELPANFGDLKSLKWLFLYKNPISTLPESFGGLSQLEQFRMQHANLKSLPSTIGPDLQNYLNALATNAIDYASS